jgi:hypothetical protein
LGILMASVIYITMCKRNKFLSVPVTSDICGHLNAKCHAMMLMAKLLIISVTYDTSQNKLSDTIMHLTLIAMNSVV